MKDTRATAGIANAAGGFDGTWDHVKKRFSSLVLCKQHGATHVGQLDYSLAETASTIVLTFQGSVHSEPENAASCC